MNEKIKFWVASFIIWVYWLAMTHKIVPSQSNEPLIVSVFIGVSKIIPGMLDIVESLLYNMIRGP